MSDDDYDEFEDGKRGRVSRKSFFKKYVSGKAMPNFSERYQARVERLLGVSKKPSQKCTSLNGKPRVRSLTQSKLTKTGKARCILTDTRDMRRNMLTYNRKHAEVAVKKSQLIKPNRSLAGRIKKYIKPRVAVARSGSRKNRAVMTGGGLVKSDFTINKWGRLVSKKASASAIKRYNELGDSKAILKEGQSITLERLLERGADISKGQKALVKKLMGKSGQSKGMKTKGKKKTKGMKTKGKTVSKPTARRSSRLAKDNALVNSLFA